MAPQVSMVRCFLAAKIIGSIVSRKISEQEQVERHVMMRNALTSQRIDSLEPKTQAIADVEKWACGEMIIAESAERYKSRIKVTQRT
jgi:hypothetical protein